MSEETIVVIIFLRIFIIILSLLTLLILKLTRFSNKYPFEVGELIIYEDEKKVPYFYLQINEKDLKKIQEMDKVSLKVTTQKLQVL